MGLEHDHNHHSHGHQHHVHGEVKNENLLFATILNFVITVVEIIGGLFSGSFALLSDALHNFGDTLAMFLAYLSSRISKRTPTSDKTFGLKRVQILAAMINGLAMAVICIYIIIEAYHRFKNPQPINGAMMVIIATIGLLANFIAMSILQNDKEKSLNVKAAYLHLLGDTLSSVAVVIGGILIYFYRIYWIDPVITFIIAIYIFRETWFVLKQAYLILVQATPAELNLHEVKRAIELLHEVENVHHVHAWKLDDKQNHFECHVDLKTDLHISETDAVLFKIKQILSEDFNLNHSTIQFEYNCCNDKSLIKMSH
jgi:cobalt-zinc-cadmium efflux system protein